MIRFLGYLFRSIKRFVVLNPEDLQIAARELREIASMIDVCNDVVDALHDTKNKYIRSYSLFSWLFPTDYERSRRQILQMCRGTSHRISKIRRSSVSADAIKAYSSLDKIKKCCLRCKKNNQQNIRENKKPICVIHKEFNSDLEKKFRFELNKAGQILERL